MESFSQLFADGSPYAWPLAFIAGILSVATPCVLPMLPITLGTLGISKAQTRRKALTLSLAYVAGIVVCFTSLGVFSALTGTLFGSFLGHPVTAVAIAVIFVALAGSSFELYELSVPSWLSLRLQRAGGNGHPGAFAMGLVAGFIAVPCIGPVLLGILTYVASTANVVAGAGLLAVYALGFGLPFVAVGVMAFKLPKRGPWMRAVKSLFGLALLVTAFWFLRGPFPWLRQHADAAIGLALLAAGLIAGALHLHFDGSTLQRVRKTIGIGASVIGSALALNALLAQNLTDWCHDKGDGACIAAECEAHAVTVVDFGAEWCPFCVKLEKETFTDATVRLRLQDAGLVKVDTDHDAGLSNGYGVEGIPTVVFLDRQCKEIGRFVGFRSPAAFIKYMDSLKH